MTTKEYLKLIDEVNERGKFKPDWASLSHHKAPEWYMRDKIGVFIHWGIYSVPAFGNEWYSRAMYDPNCREFEHHKKTMATKRNLVIKILFLCSRQKILMLKNGLHFSKKQV